MARESGRRVVDIGSDKPVETVEISLKTGRILQCFGACNRFTDYHEEITKLVNKHSHKFIRS
jgi:hypothetical protein